MIRVGSSVFKTEPFGSHAGNRSPNEAKRVDSGSEAVTPTKLEKHKASTYDHVHQIVRCARTGGM